MPWTKLGDEFPDETRDLSDRAFRTHVEALVWSNRHSLDLVIPKADMRYFAKTRYRQRAAEELVAAGWWEDLGKAWFIGNVHPEWQPTRERIEAQREAATQRSRRFRDKSPIGTNNYPYPEQRVTEHVASGITEVADELERRLRDVFPRKSWSSRGPLAVLSRVTSRAEEDGVSPKTAAESIFDAAVRFRERTQQSGVPANKIVWLHRWLEERWDLDYPPERKAAPSHKARIPGPSARDSPSPEEAPKWPPTSPSARTRVPRTRARYPTRST
jgi:hypothetical protein